MLPSLASDARSAAGTRLQTSAIHTYIYTIRACIGHHPECFPARLLARPQLVSCRALNALAWSNYIRIHQEHGGGGGTGRAHRTHMMPPPLRVGSTEDGSAANVHKKRCNESRSSAEGGRDPLPLLSARQAFLHARRRYLCFMGFVSNVFHAASLRAHSPLVRGVSISYLLAVTDLC